MLIATATGCGSGTKLHVAHTATTAHSSPTATPTATSTPTPSPTPDPLATAPVTADAARSGLEHELLNAPGDACPQRLQSEWSVRCVSGDLDGDGKPDTAYLIPLQQSATGSFQPAALFVLRSGSMQLESLPFITTPDAGSVGAGWFAYLTAARGGPAISVLTTACTTTACTSQAHIEKWDGTAWRDVGPGDAGVINLESISWDSANRLVMRGGKISAPGAGPTRDVTVVYTYNGTRYAEASRTYDAPVYLFHAITDADAKFDVAQWQQAIDAYQAAITNQSLKDWKAEQGESPGNPALDSYALFRIAVATAAMGGDPSIALDTVVVRATDLIFAYAAEQFRQGWLSTGTVHGGCLAATAYLATVTSTANNPAYIQQAFNYGYANQPGKTYRDICPL